ncbi:MAG: response regulator, partial [Desulfobacteraceae bacterium]|nr:response regulator [Desulfobacteraceae bacterium]
VKLKEFFNCVSRIACHPGSDYENINEEFDDGDKDQKTEKDFKGNYNILLAEDDEMNQIVATSLIESMNIGNVQIAQNGKKAVEMFAAGQFDLILMDGQMPVMSGLDATAAIRAMEKKNNLPRIPIIALTAHALKQDRDIFINGGMDDYLTKPINPRALSRSIKKMALKAPDKIPVNKILVKKTPIQKDGQYVIDPSELKELMLGNQSLLIRCVQTFSSSYQPLMEKIIKNVEDADCQELMKSGHRLKGMFKYLAAHKAAKMAEQLEMMGYNEDIKSANELISKIETESGRILKFLDTMIENDSFNE